MPAQGIVVTVDWWEGSRVPRKLRTKVADLVQALAPQINEFEACLHELERLASNGHEFLMPKIELTIPVYEEGAVFRLRMVRLDTTQMILETRKGEAVGEVLVR